MPQFGVSGDRRARENGTNESFNGRFRELCLSAEWFRSRAEARVVIETWRNH
jgi:putative transposase